ncbi:MAG: ATP-binding protein [Thioalkalispiraceae bacterium]|jgi:PAS domain S-box-containing protein
MTFNSKSSSKRIAHRLIIAIVLFSSLITFFTSAYQLYGQYTKDVTAIKQHMVEIETVYLSSIATQIWVADKKEMRVLLNGLLNLPNIVYIEVREQGKMWLNAGEMQSKNKIVKNYPIYYMHRGKQLHIADLYVQATLNDVYQNLYDEALTILVSNAIKTFFVAGFIFLLFELLVTRHLHRISDFASKLNLSNLNMQLKLNRKSRVDDADDELDVVVKAFTRMQSNIKSSVKELEERDIFIQLIMDSTASAIYGVDLKGDCTFVNKACLDLLGYQKEELLGINMHKMLHFKYDDGSVRAPEECHLYKTINTKTRTHKTNEVAWCSDGSFIYIECWAYPILRNDTVEGAVVSFTDITERRAIERKLALYQGHLEELVNARTGELQQMYNELESFSYSVSHDLRTPLRAINGFAHILEEDKREQLDEEGRLLLTKICTASEKMGGLIDSILSLSRIRRLELDIQEVDLTCLCHSILEELNDTCELNKLNFNIEDDIIVNGDRRLLKIALENLVNNALKFSAVKDEQILNIGKYDDRSGTVIYVQDNGVGFDMSYKDRLFKPFQRLHGEKEYSGYGIGLATVFRIIERHGGRIWADSKPEEGTTIYFSLATRVN